MSVMNRVIFALVIYRILVSLESVPSNVEAHMTKKDYQELDDYMRSHYFNEEYGYNFKLGNYIEVYKYNESERPGHHDYRWPSMNKPIFIGIMERILTIDDQVNVEMYLSYHPNISSSYRHMIFMCSNQVSSFPRFTLVIGDDKKVRTYHPCGLFNWWLYLMNKIQP